MTYHSRPGRRLCAALTTALVAAGLSLAALGAPSAVADTAPQNPSDPKTPVTVSSDALPTPQINGVVWDTAIVGNTVYAGGSFTNARPAGSAAGQNTVARGNMVAFNVTTGADDQLRSVVQRPDPVAGGVAGPDAAIRRRRVHDRQPEQPALADRRLQHGDRRADHDASPRRSTTTCIAVAATNTTVYAGGAFSSVGSVSTGEAGRLQRL